MVKFKLVLVYTKIETMNDIEEQFDKVSETKYEPNEKFKQSLNLSVVGRTQGIQ